MSDVYELFRDSEARDFICESVSVSSDPFLGVCDCCGEEDTVPYLFPQGFYVVQAAKCYSPVGAYGAQLGNEVKEHVAARAACVCRHECRYHDFLRCHSKPVLSPVISNVVRHLPIAEPLPALRQTLGYLFAG